MTSVTAEGNVLAQKYTLDDIHKCEQLTVDIWNRAEKSGDHVELEPVTLDESGASTKHPRSNN